jgi:hypothetical protein
MSTVVMFAFILGLIFLLPAQIMIFTSLFISVLALIWDDHFDRRNVINWIVLAVNVLVCTAYYVMGLESILPYIGYFFYGGIMIVAIASVVARRPMTLPRKANDKWELRFHSYNTLVVAGFQLAALILSYALMPNILYIILPMVVSISSVGLSFRIVRSALAWNYKRRTGETYEGI